MSIFDRWAITEVLARYAHVVDNRAWEELGSVFTADAELAEDSNVSGLAGIQAYLEAFDPKRSHHTLNTIVSYVDETEAHAWSRFVIVEFDASTLTGDYRDEIVATPGGPRIRKRLISVRNRPDRDDVQVASFESWAGTQ